MGDQFLISESPQTTFGRIGEWVSGNLQPYIFGTLCTCPKKNSTKLITMRFVDNIIYNIAVFHFGICHRPFANISGKSPILSEVRAKLPRPKLKLSLFPQTRPTRENRPDSNNFFAIFFEELFFPDFSVQPLLVCCFTIKCHMRAFFVAISLKRQVYIDPNGGV